MAAFEIDMEVLGRCIIIDICMIDHYGVYAVMSGANGGYLMEERRAAVYRLKVRDVLLLNPDSIYKKHVIRTHTEEEQRVLRTGVADRQVERRHIYPPV